MKGKDFVTKEQRIGKKEYTTKEQRIGKKEYNFAEALVYLLYIMAVAYFAVPMIKWLIG